jgi:class 3 adenylate cyclase
MDSLKRVKSTMQEGSREPVALDRLTLRYLNPELESAFHADFFRHNLGNLRVALLAGAVLWVVFGLALDGHILAVADRRTDRVMRYGVFIPILLIGLALSFTRVFNRVWEWVAVTLTVATILGWVYYVSQVLTLPPDYGFVGLILITAFTFTLLRLRFVLVAFITLVGLAAYLPYLLSTAYISDVRKVMSILYLVSFGGVGGMAAYRLERFNRLLFLRERQLDSEYRRSDSLLLNILPQAIVARLKAQQDGGRIADALDEVSVVFADAVGSTEQAAKSSPKEFADTLDQLFRGFDAIADRHGLEKIKTVGDAYMAAAGAPVPMSNHAEAAADMALEMVGKAQVVHWPSGDPVLVRVGVASGPAVAGVIGQRKFAYDLWGDTVNLASRLQENGEPGRVLVAGGMADLLADRYEFGPPLALDLKGKGPTPARFLIDRAGRTASATQRDRTGLRRTP